MPVKPNLFIWISWMVQEFLKQEKVLLVNSISKVKKFCEIFIFSLSTHQLKISDVATNTQQPFIFNKKNLDRKVKTWTTVSIVQTLLQERVFSNMNARFARDFQKWPSRKVRKNMDLSDMKMSWMSIISSIKIYFSKTISYPVIARFITVLSVWWTGQKLNLD